MKVLGPFPAETIFLIGITGIPMYMYTPKQYMVKYLDTCHRNRWYTFISRFGLRLGKRLGKDFNPFLGHLKMPVSMDIPNGWQKFCLLPSGPRKGFKHFWGTTWIPYFWHAFSPLHKTRVELLHLLCKSLGVSPWLIPVKRCLYYICALFYMMTVIESNIKDHQSTYKHVSINIYKPWNKWGQGCVPFNALVLE